MTCYYELGVTGSHTAPFTAAYRPLPLAETDVALSSDRIEGRYEITWAVGDVQATRDSRFVNVHWIRVFEARETRTEQVHNDQIVLKQDDDGVRVLVFCSISQKTFRNFFKRKLFF